MADLHYKTLQMTPSSKQLKLKCFIMLIASVPLCKANKYNLVFRATVLKTLGRVSSVVFFLRIETSIIKTPTKKPTVFS